MKKQVMFYFDQQSIDGEIALALRQLPLETESIERRFCFENLFHARRLSLAKKISCFPIDEKSKETLKRMDMIYVNAILTRKSRNILLEASRGERRVFIFDEQAKTLIKKRGGLYYTFYDLYRAVLSHWFEECSNTPDDVVEIVYEGSLSQLCDIPLFGELVRLRNPLFRIHCLTERQTIEPQRDVKFPLNKTKQMTFVVRKKSFSDSFFPLLAKMGMHRLLPRPKERAHSVMLVGSKNSIFVGDVDGLEKKLSLLLLKRFFFVDVLPVLTEDDIQSLFSEIAHSDTLFGSR